MNLDKIGKFISKCRKDKKLTQEALAEKLGISDRAVSKWERGLNLPDASLMIELCDILDITLNDLLTGEVIKKDNYMKKAEENLLELEKMNEEQTKRLLTLEWVIGLTCSISFFIMIFAASYAITDTLWQVILIIFAFIIFIVGMLYSIMIEQKAGYYECQECFYRYVPTYKQVLFSSHIGRKRYMKCPKCRKKSMNKKVINK